jgi:phosphoribosylaminoimidazole-succinocarboxamide synthase
VTTTPIDPTAWGLEPLATGKVRDLYRIDDDRILIVTSDRISAYDVVLPTPIPDKGRVLTQLSVWWFDNLQEHCPNHLESEALADLPAGLVPDEARSYLAGRIMLVRRVEIFPVECVVRGYLSGSGWKSYQQDGTVCGLELPPGLQESQELPEPIFTPTTKATEGHDLPMTFAQVVDQLGQETAEALRSVALVLYAQARDHARRNGIIIADTKFEFGRAPDGRILLADEVFTPDSSRFWPADRYEVGRGQESFDKQYVRNFLDRSGWQRQPPAPALPAEVVLGTRQRYLEAYQRITGIPLAVKEYP